MLHATWDLKHHFQLRVLPATLRHLPLMTLVSPPDLAIFLDMVCHGHWCCPHYGCQLRFGRLSLAVVLKTGTPKAAGNRSDSQQLWNKEHGFRYFFNRVFMSRFLSVMAKRDAMKSLQLGQVAWSRLSLLLSPSPADRYEFHLFLVRVLAAWISRSKLDVVSVLEREIVRSLLWKSLPDEAALDLQWLRNMFN